MQRLRYMGPVLRRTGQTLLNMLLLVAFVLAVSTMPPLMVGPFPGHFPGFRIGVDTLLWRNDIFKYLQLVGSGTLGQDQSGHLVSALLVERLSRSLMLLLVALLLALVLGTLKGVSDFRQQRRSHLALGPILTGAVEGVPDFLLIFLVQWLGVRTYQWLSHYPAVIAFFGGLPMPVVYSTEAPIRSFLLPALCLTLVPWSYVARTVSQAMHGVWEQDYIRSAKAKGLKEAVVIYRHALRNAIIPLLDDLPNLLTITLSNLLVVEYLFNYPGFTIFVKEGVDPVARAAPGINAGYVFRSHDTPVLVAGGVAIGLVLAVAYLGLSLARYWSDPRLKEGEDR